MLLLTTHSVHVEWDFYKKVDGISPNCNTTDTLINVYKKLFPCKGFGNILLCLLESLGNHGDHMWFIGF